MTRSAACLAALTALVAAATLAIAAGSLIGPRGSLGDITFDALVESVAGLIPGEPESPTSASAAAPSGSDAGQAAEATRARSRSNATGPAPAAAPDDGAKAGNDTVQDGHAAEAGSASGWWPDPETGDVFGPDGEAMAETYGPLGDGSSLAGLLQALGAAGPEAQTRAAEAFVAAASAASMEDVMAAALPGLYDWDPTVRYYSLVALGASALGSTDNAALLADAVPHILGRLADNEAAVREAAAATLAAVQPAPPDWTAGPLSAALADPDPRVVAAAQAALERVGAADTYTLEAVSVGLYSDDAMLRSRAVRTLGAVAGDTEAGLSLLIWSLGDPDAAVRWQAATSLGELGPTAIEATYDLVAMAQDPDEDAAVRDAAATALASIAQ